MNQELSANTLLSHYRIVSKLGAGGMGKVYRARDTRLDREVAIKVLPASFANDPDRLRRFEVEAKATSALNHPHILTVHDSGTASIELDRISLECTATFPGCRGLSNCKHCGNLERLPYTDLQTDLGGSP